MLLVRYIHILRHENQTDKGILRDIYFVRMTNLYHFVTQHWVVLQMLSLDTQAMGRLCDIVGFNHYRLTG